MASVAQAAETAATGTQISVARTTDNWVLVRAAGDVAFEPGRAALKGPLRLFLDVLAASLAAAPNVTLVVLGHTDSIGSDAVNQRISQERANAVKNYLASRGVAVERITAEGRGERESVAENNTEEGRAQNRRVELLIAHEVKP